MPGPQRSLEYGDLSEIDLINCVNIEQVMEFNIRYILESRGFVLFDSVLCLFQYLVSSVPYLCIRLTTKSTQRQFLLKGQHNMFCVCLGGT